MTTFSKIYVHIIFSVKQRQPLIKVEWEERLFQYISGLVRNKEQKIYAINGTNNHIHMLISVKPNCNLSDLVREIKKSSTIFIANNKLSKYKFNWQNGFGAFSCSHSQIDIVVRYINNQKEHHKLNTYEEEYVQFLKKYSVDFEEEYIFN